MMTMHQRFMIRLTLGLALSIAAVPAQASVILDTGLLTFTADGIQFGRLARDGTPSDWSAPKDFPGVIGAPTPRSYELFTIDSDIYSFLQISFDDPLVQFFVSAYLGSFVPVNAAPNYGLDTNYLGDAGLSQPIGNPSFFQIVVAPHSQIVIPIVELTSGAGTGRPFSLLVEGFLDTEYNDVPQVPEPATAVLLGSGLAVSALLRQARQRRSRQAARAAIK